MNHRDRDQHQRDPRYARGLRDTYNPEPQWLRQDRENRNWGRQRDEEFESGIGGSQYGGSDYGYGGSGRGSYAGSGREWGDQAPLQSRMQEGRGDPRRTSGSGDWDDNLDTGESQRRYEPFHVGTGMGLGASRSRFSPDREFGQSYGGASGYGGHSGWDLGTHQRDIVGATPRQSFRGMGPSHYKRSDERIRDDVYERLTDSHVIDARSITVDVNQGNVTLTGTVSERRMRYAAEDLVERIGGVANINNQLRVQSQEETRAQAQQPQTQSSDKQEDKRH